MNFSYNIDFKDVSIHGLPKTSHEDGIFIVSDGALWFLENGFKFLFSWVNQSNREHLDTGVLVENYEEVLWFVMEASKNQSHLIKHNTSKNASCFQNVRYWAYGPREKLEHGSFDPLKVTRSRGKMHPTQSNIVIKWYNKVLKKVIQDQDGYIRKEDKAVIEMWLELISSVNFNADPLHLRHIKIIRNAINSGKKIPKADRDYIDYQIIGT